MYLFIFCSINAWKPLRTIFYSYSKLKNLLFYWFILEWIMCEKNACVKWENFKKPNWKWLTTPLERGN